MIIRLVFGAFLFLFSCKEAPVLTPEEETSEILDSDPPIIKWLSPRFDAVVNEVVTVKCQVTDNSNIDIVELWVDTLQTDLIDSSVADSVYTLKWSITNHNNGDEPLLFVKAVDDKGNDTISQKIRVIIDKNHVYPEPVTLYPLDSLFVDLVFSGYTLRWGYSGDQHFKKYILQQSIYSLMTESTEIFSTEKKSTIQYDDYENTTETAMYYRIIVEDIFGKQTVGNVVTNSMVDMPPQWNIQSVQYTANSLSVSWDNTEFAHYYSHQLLFADKRDGEFEILKSYSDFLINQYETDAYSPFSENWFSIQTEDTLGQISISQPYMHPPPQAPGINSVSYIDNSFRVQWNKELDIDFVNYRIMFTGDGNVFNLSEIQLINNQSENTLHYSNSIGENQYYLFQVITTDAWGLETRGPIIMAGSFYKFAVIENNDSNEALYSVITNHEGKYVAVGGDKGDKSICNEGGWFVLFDEYGEVEISKNIGELNSALCSITQAYIGEYFVTGYKDGNLLIKKIDNNGDVKWSHNDYEFEYSDAGNATIRLSDGNIGVTGYVANTDILAVKISENDGSEIWSTFIGGNETDEGHDILPSANGGMFILGETHSQGDIDGDIWILELDSDGIIIDTLLINLPGKQIGYSFAQSDNGGFTIAGEISGSSGVIDALMVQVSGTGEVEWIFSYGGIYNDRGYSLVYSDGGWVLAGQTYSYDMGGGGDAWLVKVSAMGNFEWMQTYGDTYNDTAFDIDVASDGGLIICGSTYNIQDNQNAGWLIKTDSRGNYKGILSYP